MPSGMFGGGPSSLAVPEVNPLAGLDVPSPPGGEHRRSPNQKYLSLLGPAEHSFTVNQSPYWWLRQSNMQEHPFTSVADAFSHCLSANVVIANNIRVYLDQFETLDVENAPNLAKSALIARTIVSKSIAQVSTENESRYADVIVPMLLIYVLQNRKLLRSMAEFCDKPPTNSTPQSLLARSAVLDGVRALAAGLQNLTVSVHGVQMVYAQRAGSTPTKPSPLTAAAGLASLGVSGSPPLGAPLTPHRRSRTSGSLSTDAMDPYALTPAELRALLGNTPASSPPVGSPLANRRPKGTVNGAGVVESSDSNADMLPLRRSRPSLAMSSLGLEDDPMLNKRSVSGRASVSSEDSQSVSRRPTLEVVLESPQQPNNANPKSPRNYNPVEAIADALVQTQIRRSRSTSVTSASSRQNETEVAVPLADSSDLSRSRTVSTSAVSPRPLGRRRSISTEAESRTAEPAGTAKVGRRLSSRKSPVNNYEALPEERETVLSTKPFYKSMPSLADSEQPQSRSQTSSSASVPVVVTQSTASSSDSVSAVRRKNSKSPKPVGSTRRTPKTVSATVESDGPVPGKVRTHGKRGTSGDDMLSPDTSGDMQPVDEETPPQSPQARANRHVRASSSDARAGAP